MPYNIFSILILNSFLEKIDGSTPDLLCNNYLGFIVLRPLPNAPLAKVCISTYPQTNEKNRYFPTLKTYRVHLLGQEQP